jgi:hypothetical protein
MKYVSDKYAGKPGALIEVPKGGSFADMVALKGDKEIGDKINKIIGRLAEANDLKGVIDQADFNDESKLGSGKDMQDRFGTTFRHARSSRRRKPLRRGTGSTFDWANRVRDLLRCRHVEPEDRRSDLHARQERRRRDDG